MTHTIQTAASASFAAPVSFRLPTMGSVAGSTKDAGQVRVGGFGPVFRLSREDRASADAGQVRVGGFGPVFRLSQENRAGADAGTVRVGGFGPLFR